MSKNPEFVKFDKVDKSYDGKVLVVKDLQLDISEGEFITMLGPSGSGKTTCLMMLAGFDHSITRASASLGSTPLNTFMKITLPLILPGVISGGLFAFVTSFDEVVVVLFLAGLDNTTIPIQMWVGLREQLSPTILAVATCLIILSTLVLLTAELLRRRSERLRGISR